MAEKIDEFKVNFAVSQDEELFSNVNDEENAELMEENLEVFGENEEEKKEIQKVGDEIPATETEEETVIEEEKVSTTEIKEETENQTQVDEEESVESPPSDFKIQREGSDFLRPDIILSIPSKTSQFTAISEYEAPQQRRRMSEASKVVSQERDRRISGDFRVAADMPSIETLLSETEGRSMESEVSIVIEEEEKEEFDREAYYDVYNQIAAEITPLKIRNNFFQKKLAEYYKKRKMEHVLKETDQQVDTQKKYHLRLDALDELLKLDTSRRTVINAELSELKKDRDEKADFVNKTMKQFLDKEKDTGTGLIHTKTGKEIPEKEIGSLLRRQSSAVEQIAKQRLKYIKIRNLVTEKQLAIQNVETLGPSLRIVDFEQLKVENRGFADKLEEREDELSKLRTKCDNIFQVLAHLREKSAAATLDIIEEQGALREIEIEFMEARERKNYFKVERDRYRIMINNIKEQSGILFKSRLLKDMENAVNEIETTEKILHKIKEKQRTQLSKLRAIRKSIEVAVNFRLQHEREKVVSAALKVSSIYKGRPVLLQK